MSNYNDIAHIRALAERATIEAYNAGLRKGLTEGASKLSMLSALVPSSVTKQWIIDEAERQAALLLAKVREV